MVLLRPLTSSSSYYYYSCEYDEYDDDDDEYDDSASSVFLARPVLAITVVQVIGSLRSVVVRPELVERARAIAIERERESLDGRTRSSSR